MQAVIQPELLGDEERLRPAQRVVILVILISFCLATRLWIILHSQDITNDGPVYIAMAQKLFHSPRQVLQQYDYHPGYPAALAIVHRILTRTGLAHGPEGWDTAGQLTSLVASLLAMVGLWFYSERILGWRVALFTTFTIGVTRKWSILGADVISDALAVALQLWAVVFAFTTLSRLQRNSNLALVMAALTGLCAGLGYLVRPEAILTVLLAGIVWFACQFHNRLNWRLTVGSFVITALTAMACAGPYMLAIGSFSKKKHFDEIIGLPLGDIPLATGVDARQLFSAFGMLETQLGEAMHFALWGLVLIWLAAWVLKHLPRYRSINQHILVPNVPGSIVMIAAIALISPILMGLFIHVHYLDYRHATFLALLLSPLSGAAAIMIARILESHWKPRSELLMHSFRIVVLLIIVSLLLKHGLRQLNPTAGYERLAAQQLKTLLAPDDYVLTTRMRILHYSEARGVWLRAPVYNEKALLDRLNGTPGVTILAIGKSDLADKPNLAKVLNNSNFRLLVHTYQSAGNNHDEMLIFRQNPSK